MKRLRIKIESVECGYVCIASNGDYPFEGRVHDSVDDAKRDLEAAYYGHVWDFRWKSKTVASIKIG